MNCWRIGRLLLAVALVTMATADEDEVMPYQGQVTSRNLFPTDDDQRLLYSQVNPVNVFDDDVDDDDIVTTGQGSWNPFLGANGGYARDTSFYPPSTRSPYPSVGVGGYFWNDYQNVQQGVEADDNDDNIFSQTTIIPIPKIDVGSYFWNNDQSVQQAVETDDSDDNIFGQTTTNPFLNMGGPINDQTVTQVNADEEENDNDDNPFSQFTMNPFLNIGNAGNSLSDGQVPANEGDDDANDDTVVQSSYGPVVVTDNDDDNEDNVHTVQTSTNVTNGDESTEVDDDDVVVQTTAGTFTSDDDNEEAAVPQTIAPDDDADDDDDELIQTTPGPQTTDEDDNDDNDEVTQATPGVVTDDDIDTDDDDEVIQTTQGPDMTDDDVDDNDDDEITPSTPGAVTTDDDVVDDDDEDEITQITSSTIPTTDDDDVDDDEVTQTTSASVTTVDDDDDDDDVIVSTTSFVPITTDDDDNDDDGDEITQTTPTAVTTDDDDDDDDDIEITQTTPISTVTDENADDDSEETTSSTPAVITTQSSDDDEDDDDGDSDCQRLVDVVVVVDGSDSISAPDFSLLKDSLVSLVNSLAIGVNGPRFGLVLYSQDVTAQLPLSGNASLLTSQIMGLQHPRDGTNTDLGIAAMTAMFNSTGRVDVPRVGVVITDGISKDTAATALQARLARAAGVNMFAVGVGSKTDMTELLAIASRPSQVLTAEQFSQLRNTISMLVRMVCPTTTTSTTTTTPATTTTPMTTTTTPMTTTTTPTTTTEKPDQGLCNNCKIVNGIGYNPHPYDCNRYVQCQPIGEGKYIIHIRTCAHGTHWNQKILTCDKPKEAACPYDKCRAEYGVQRYAGEWGCRSYWACQGGVAEGLCCPWGQAFVHGRGCVPDEYCRDPCGAPTYPGLCEKKPVSGKPHLYQEKVWFVWVPRFCPPGTLFNQYDCQCSIFGNHDITPAPVCKPEIYLPFNNGVQDESGNGNYIDNEGVKVINGAAYFDGKSSLRVPRFSNAELGSTLVVRLQFREAVASPGRAALINNGDCNVDGTLFVAKDADAVSMGVKSTAGTLYTVSQPCQGGDWKTVEMVYDAGTLRGTLDGHSSLVPTEGKIATSKYALQIGRGEGFLNFHGYMDEIAVYLCR